MKRKQRAENQRVAKVVEVARVELASRESIR